MNTALATRPTKGSVVQFRPNQNIERHMQAAKQHRKEMESLNGQIRKTLDAELGWNQTIFSKMFGWIVPKRFYGAMPVALLKWLAEEADVLEQIEGIKRESIDRGQQIVADIGQTAIDEVSDLERFVADINRAENENWSARQLHEYIVTESNLSINPVISQLLDDKFNLLSDEQKEHKRQDFTEELKILALNRKELIKALANTTDACLSQINAEVREYYSYTRIYRPVAVIRNSVKGMLETDKSLYMARQALLETMAASVNGLALVIQGISNVSDFRISSVEFRKALNEGNKRIDSGLAVLEEKETGYRKGALKGTAVTSVPVRQLTESTVAKVENN